MDSNGGQKHIRFWPLSLHLHEENYSTLEKKCLAVLWALYIFLPYLQGCFVTFHPEQASMRWIMYSTEPNGRAEGSKTGERS